MFEKAKTGSILGIIIFLSLLIKLTLFLVLFHLGADFKLPDSSSYLDPAQMIYHGGNLLHNQSLWTRTPLYPFLIAAIYFITGAHTISIIIFQILLSGLLCFNAYRIAKLLYNENSGLIAAAIVAVNYLFISYANLIMTDLVFAVLMSYIFYYIAAYFHKASLMKIASIGFFLALATLTRPISYYLTPLIALALFGYTFHDRSFKVALGAFILLLLPSMVLVGGWQLRNKQVFGTYQYTDIDAVNLYHYYAADVIASSRHISIKEARKVLDSEAPTLHFNSPVEKANYYRKKGAAVLLAHPFWAAWQGVSGFFRTVFGNDYILLYYNQNLFNHGKQLEQYLYHLNFKNFISTAGFADYLKILAVGFVFIFNFIIVMLSIVYLCKHFKENISSRSTLVVFLIIIGYFLLVSSNYCSLARFRMPFEIIFDSFAAITIYEYRRKFASRAAITDHDLKLILGSNS
jgi:4-amino-4-deoxy-L-arabinose transferase-like glycosyltransferase